jgi:L-threonylcarbamoyladenylate synthase
LEKWAVKIPNFARELVDNFWPGPMTVILKRSKIAKDFITGCQETVALRLPKNNVALSVLKSFHELGGNGLAAPSANLYGAVSPTLADDVIEDLGKSFDGNFDFVIDGGKCEIGIESTIINCTSKFPTILRKGAIQEIDISNIHIEIEGENFKNQKIRFPGNMKKHYSPKAIVVNEGPIRNGDGYIAMRDYPTPKNCIRLAAPKDIQEFGQQLYSAFRLGDKLGLQRIYVVSPENIDFGAAIQDRIERASSAFNFLN